MSAALRHLGEAERDCVLRYVDVLTSELGERLHEVWLYGSFARGDAWREGHPIRSDVDLLVLTHEALDADAAEDLVGRTYELFLECGRQLAPQFRPLSWLDAPPDARAAEFQEHLRADARRLHPRPWDVFCYGTLQLPEVLEAVTGRTWQWVPATLPDHRRGRVRGQSFPGVTPEPGARTPGRLLSNLTAEAVRRLDAFEGELYERACCEVVLPGGARTPAELYVVPPSRAAAVTEESWDLEEFRTSHLATFLAERGDRLHEGSAGRRRQGRVHARRRP